MFLLAGGVAWALMAREDRFLPEFRRLLTDFTVETGTSRFLTGRSVARGRYDSRAVAISLDVGRGEHRMGSLIVAVKTSEPLSLSGADIDDRAKGDAARRGLFTLAVEEMMLTVDEGWLRARWQPLGWRTFPGRFSEAKWRKVLDSLNAVASALDAPQA
jgi:hypothetical protein